MKNKKLVLVSALAAALLVVGCEPSTSSSSSSTSSTGPRQLTYVDTYTTTFSADMYTYDYLATHYSADSEVLVNLVDGLVEYDVYGILRPSLAESWTISEDGTQYTFHLREANWVDAEGSIYAPVTADDFVAGLQHLLDAEGGLEYLTWGVIKNAQAYSQKTITDFSQVGVKALDEKTVVYTLEEAIPYFFTYLTYNPFMPLNREFFLSKGGAFGLAEYAAAKDNVTFGVVGKQSSILYNGAYIMTGYASKSLISLTANPEYWDAENVTLQNIRYIFDDGSNLDQTFSSFLAGTYSGMGISNVILPRAKQEIPDSIYKADTNSTTYYAAWNINRQNYAVGSAVSPKTEQEKADTKVAILNKNFRKAVQFAWDRSKWNAQTKGEELAESGLRTTLTAPEFVSLPQAYTEEGRNYAIGSIYGDVVESEYKKLDSNFTGTLADNKEGVFNVARAKELRDAAKAELQGKVTFPIALDIVYYSPSTNQSKQAQSFKNSVETVLGTDFIKVNLMAATTTDDYYNSGYRAASGKDSNFDLFWGSGWGPDYGDPLTYLSIFDYGADMMTVIGITVEGDEVEDADDLAAYNAVLPEYHAMLEAAKKEFDMTRRYVLFAKLEAYLLESGIIINTTTQGGNYAATRIIPRTVPYTLFGTDNEKFKHMKVVREILTADEVRKFKDDWAVERAKKLAEANK